MSAVVVADDEEPPGKSPRQRTEEARRRSRVVEKLVEKTRRQDHLYVLTLIAGKQTGGECTVTFDQAPPFRYARRPRPPPTHGEKAPIHVDADRFQLGIRECRGDQLRRRTAAELKERRDTSVGDELLEDGRRPLFRARERVAVTPAIHATSCRSR